MKLSIIIPIYNLESYLEKCLDSIVCQDCQAIEVVLVNDGSVDNSGKIADDYANRYSFISVIHQENQGVSVDGAKLGFFIPKILIFYTIFLKNYQKGYYKIFH